MFQPYKTKSKLPIGLVCSSLFLTISLIASAKMIASARPFSLARPIQAEALIGGPTQEAEAARRLEPGQPIERELAGGATHSYQINLSAGEFLYLIVDQEGIDVLVSLLDPAGKQIFQVNSPNEDRGPEPIWYVANTAGLYKVVVEPQDEDAAPAKYQIRIEVRRVAATEDRQRAEGQAKLLAGVKLVEQKTAESLKQATEKFQAALELWHASGDRPGEADALILAGWSYTTQSSTGGLAPAGKGDRQKALEYYERALVLLRDLRDKRREAYLLRLIGLEYGTTTVDQKQKAIAYYKESLGLMREIGDRWGEAFLLDTIGLTYAFMTETQKALDTLTELLPLERSLGDRRAAAITLNYIGGLHSWLGDYQKALDYYTQGLSESRAVGDHEAELYATRNIGTAYFGLGDYPKALGYFEEINRLNEKDPEDHGLTLGDIGSVHFKLGDYQQALKYYNEALAIWRQFKIVRLESSTLINIGAVYRELGDYQKALDFNNQALPLKRYVGDRRGEAAILINIGKVHLLSGDARNALVSYQQALELSQAVADRSLEAQALDGAAIAKRKLGELTEALKLSDDALKIVESVRAKISTRELRASYHASVQQYYDANIDLLMALHRADPAHGYDALALEASERARSRSLLESLNEAGVDIRQGVEPQLLEREKTLQQQLHSQAEAYMRLLNGKHTEEQVADAKKATDTLMAAYQEVEGQIRIRSPRYAALTQPVAFSLKEIQQQLLDPDTLLLEYSLGDERSFVWAVTRNSLASFTLPKRAEIETAARRVYELLTARNRKVNFETATERQARIARADADFTEAAGALSKLLLAPVAGQLGKKRLLIVSDGPLHYLPFAALPLPASLRSGNNARDNAGQATIQGSVAGTQPLIVDHEVVNLPSVLSLAVLRRELSGRKPAPKTLAVLADPVFEKDDERVQAISAGNRLSLKTVAAKTPDSNRSLPADLMHSVSDTAAGDEQITIRRLPYTRREANQITSLLPQFERKEALDFAASRAMATSGELSQYRYVHFATHGFLNSTHPELSGIVLSLVDESGLEQDGFLRAYEIFNLKLPAEMVVLSGCRTGLGKEIKGEGLVGMTRGFMYAGAARVLVSLWDVSDEASAELMTNLYGEMFGRERLRPPAALRAAQIKIRKQKQWQAPYYWAAFVLQGEPR